MRQGVAEVKKFIKQTDKPETLVSDGVISNSEICNQVSSQYYCSKDEANKRMANFADKKLKDIFLSYNAKDDDRRLMQAVLPDAVEKALKDQNVQDSLREKISQKGIDNPVFEDEIYACRVVDKQEINGTEFDIPRDSIISDKFSYQDLVNNEITEFAVRGLAKSDSKVMSGERVDVKKLSEAYQRQLHSTDVETAYERLTKDPAETFAMDDDLVQKDYQKRHDLAFSGAVNALSHPEVYNRVKQIEQEKREVKTMAQQFSYKEEVKNDMRNFIKNDLDDMLMDEPVTARESGYVNDKGELNHEEITALYQAYVTEHPLTEEEAADRLTSDHQTAAKAFEKWGFEPVSSQSKKDMVVREMVAEEQMPELLKDKEIAQGLKDAFQKHDNEFGGPKRYEQTELDLEGGLKDLQDNGPELGR